MRYTFMIISIMICLLLVAGCSDTKNVAYFKKHPNELFESSVKCGELSDKEALKNKTCLAIAEVERPQCEHELSMMGRVITPDGEWLYSCPDRYLIALPAIRAKMQASVAGAPDPVALYFKKHPNEKLYGN